MIIFMIVDIFIVTYVIYKKSKNKISEKHKLEIQKSWKNIIKQKDMKHAILEADKLLDYTLHLMHFKGNMGNKLKKSSHLFKKDINKIWSAHKIRNNIAHQMNYEVNEKIYKKTMLSFKTAFKDLKIF